PALLRAALGSRGAAVRLGGNRLEVPGPARPDAEPLLAELRRGLSQCARPEAAEAQIPVARRSLKASVSRPRRGLSRVVRQLSQAPSNPRSRPRPASSGAP